MTDAPRPPLAVTTITDLVEVVPALLGFHPADSLVLLAVREGHVEVTARTDLTDALGRPATAALAPVWRRFPDADLIALAFTPDPERAWWALEDLSGALPTSSALLAVHADGERWYAAPDDPGAPYDCLGSVHLADAAWAGRPVRRSREELRALVEPAHSPEEVAEALERVHARGCSLEDLVGEALCLVDAHDDLPGVVDLDDVTVVSLASHDPAFLEAALLSTTGANAETRVAFWARVVAGSVPRCAGGALVALGLAAWVSGNGALHAICLETLPGRAAPAAWVRFLDALNTTAVPPTQWEGMRQAILTGPNGRICAPS